MDTELKPLISAEAVIKNLKEDKIDYGVLATTNSLGGEVSETKDALYEFNYEIVDTEKLFIHHSLFKKNIDVKDEDIKYVASHKQALLQTKNWFKNSLMEREIEDTAIGAKWLAEGILNDDTAIICNREIGKKYGLCLMAENIEDSSDNITKFIFVKKK